MKINSIIIIKTTQMLTLSGVAGAALIAALACDDTAADVPAPGLPDAGAQAGGGSSNQDDAGASGNGGTGGSTTDAGTDAAVCEIDTTAAADGCEGDSIDIAGEYTDNFGFPVSIGECSIYGNAVTTLSNDDQYVVIQNSCADPFSPGKWSRYDWTWYSGDGSAPALYLCTTVFDAATEADAIAAPRADETDPANGGCGGPDFGWSLLTPNTGSDAGADSGANVAPGDASADAAS
ncbi:MAG TPA: hypothetical protein VHO25_18735, partial [Polyangiaceae bacterium]|nr:hypothetical protein [Polyangiaceae bacterium]